GPFAEHARVDGVLGKSLLNHGEGAGFASGTHHLVAGFHAAVGGGRASTMEVLQVAPGARSDLDQAGPVFSSEGLELAVAPEEVVLACPVIEVLGNAVVAVEESTMLLALSVHCRLFPWRAV